MDLSFLKDSLVRRLREIPSSPARVRDSRLRKLASEFNKTELENCNDIIPCDLSRWGFPKSMSFDNFLYEALWRVE
jgi:hypothetical protein